jgi:hypothetical protein
VFAEEFFNNSDHPQGDVVDGQLFVAGSQGAALLVPAYHLLDPAPPAVGHPVEGLVPQLILPGRDHWPDVVPPRPLPDAGVTVAFVGGDTPGPSPSAGPPRPSRSEQDHGQGLGLMLLPGSRPDRQHDAVAVADQVNFGPEAPSGASQRMILGYWQ